LKISISVPPPARIKKKKAQVEWPGLFSLVRDFWVNGVGPILVRDGKDPEGIPKKNPGHYADF
jgi:hypothetical protein